MLKNFSAIDSMILELVKYICNKYVKYKFEVNIYAKPVMALFIMSMLTLIFFETN